MNAIPIDAARPEHIDISEAGQQVLADEFARVQAEVNEFVMARNEELRKTITLVARMHGMKPNEGFVLSDDRKRFRIEKAPQQN